MTKMIIEDGVQKFILEAEEDGVCELCGNVDELRPYGPKGENICWPCGQLNQPATVAQMRKRFSGTEAVIFQGIEMNVKFR